MTSLQNFNTHTHSHQLGNPKSNNGGYESIDRVQLERGECYKVQLKGKGFGGTSLMSSRLLYTDTRVDKKTEGLLTGIGTSINFIECWRFLRKF